MEPLRKNFVEPLPSEFKHATILINKPTRRGGIKIFRVPNERCIQSLGGENVSLTVVKLTLWYYEVCILWAASCTHQQK